MGTATLSIDIELPRDRYQAGVLRLMRGGQQVLRCRCLGRADTAIALLSNNPKADPGKRFGDTPVGLFLAAYGVVDLCRRVEGIGTGVIPLEPIGEERPVRRDIAIIAGSGNGVLAPTAGSIRIRDEDLSRLRDALADACGFSVAIREAEGKTKT